MLGLNLRQEFRGRRLKGTAIELSNEANTGATQIAAKDFLEITYPTHDLLKGIEAVGPNQGRPVVVIGERGLGKSHLMAALYHAVHDAASTRAKTRRSRSAAAARADAQAPPPSRIVASAMAQLFGWSDDATRWGF